jgi:predicted ATPase with chaperone activity
MSLATLDALTDIAESMTGAEAPPVPETLLDTGLSSGFLSDLLVKTLYVQGARPGQSLADAVCLPFRLVDELLHALQQRRLVEVRGTGGAGRAGYVFDLTATGRERAQEALSASQYVGPAPVPLELYSRWVLTHSIRSVRVNREKVTEGFRDLVIPRHVLELLGPAINSAKSLFIYGESGNGKTLIANTISRLLGGNIYVPYAIKIDGQIMLMYDPVYHREAAAEETASPLGALPIWRGGASEHDKRFVRVRRPVVAAGGELTLEDLDLQYDHHTKLYQAPAQMKANGGVLIIDDFGRQRVPPRDLLNRWIVPLEARQDYLTLHTGGKFTVPFDCLLIFATNLDPKSLVEEAFLRRIHYKVHVTDPTPEEYAEIFRRCCAARNLEYRAEGVAHVYREFYQCGGIMPRACHPRDILDHLLDTARYLEVEPTLSNELLDHACESYFLDVAAAADAE